MILDKKEHKEYMDYLKKIGYRFPIDNRRTDKNKKRGNRTPRKIKTRCGNTARIA